MFLPLSGTDPMTVPLVPGRTHGINEVVYDVICSECRVEGETHVNLLGHELQVLHGLISKFDEVEVKPPLRYYPDHSVDENLVCIVRFSRSIALYAHRPLTGF